ncbi:uncharacterized protein LOC110716680 [Chenopodium quinoa]|uniref:uncharacterized protein LOC110716680 n=1 Tax=Chenopodium quinoa TaxID=63459 RepID=UPI000B787F7E|nr:uncharacterized protein LOC110716680 [Chenopodium quinoa]
MGGLIMIGEIQEQLQKCPTNEILRSSEAVKLRELCDVKKHYFSELRQREKINWLQVGDDNTAFLHRSIKLKAFKKKIVAEKNEMGEVCDNPESIVKGFVDYYKRLLGTDVGDRVAVNVDVVKKGCMLTEEEVKIIELPFTKNEIKAALFSIPEDKAPGPDGYSSCFFKKAWGIVGQEFSAAVLDFFENGKLLKEVNCTTLSLIPKIEQLESVIDFRPIACCNVVYKCITKLLCLRLKVVLPDLISQSQTGFVENRQIIHNISIIQDLVSHYGRKNAPSSCLLKVDIKKAYDSVKWEFLEEMLIAFGFPGKFVKKGDKQSVSLLLRSLATFAASLGLVANSGKSNLYCCNISPAVKKELIEESGFKEDFLPFKYLGVSVSFKKLNKTDCQCLIDKITARIKSLGSRTLSYAGRAQLVNFVLITQLDGIVSVCRNFLWDGKAVSNRVPPIAWDFVCRSKKQGGLERSWKRVTCSNSASWSWKQFWKLKEKFKAGYSGSKWLATRKDYIVASGYNWLKEERQNVPWCNWV